MFDKNVGTSHGESCTLRNAARHNLREIQRELGSNGSINPQRTQFNEVLHGPETAKGVQALADRLMDDAGAVLKRKDAAQALELVFTLSPDALPDVRPFFGECLDFCAKEFGTANILSAVAHHDQAQPHMHVLVLPLVDGRMQGAALRRTTVRKVRFDAFKVLAESFGLRVMSGERLTAGQRRELAAMVMRAMVDAGDPATRSAAWEAIKAGIEKSPQPFADALGVGEARKQPKPKKVRTMAEIFTSTGKGPKREKEPKAYAFEGPKAYAIDELEAEKASKAYLCMPLSSSQPQIKHQDCGKYLRLTAKTVQPFTDLLGQEHWKGEPQDGAQRLLQLSN